MRHLLTLLLLTFPFVSTAFTLSDSEIDNLGIRLAKPDTAIRAESARYPARVAVPNTATHVVHAPQDGVIVNMLVAEGDIVDKGDPLASLNSPQLLMLQSDYLQARSLLGQLGTDMQRDKQLYEEGIIAERRYLESRTRYLQQQTQVEGQASMLRLSGMSDTDVAKLTAGRQMDSALMLYAPHAGVVMQQYAMPGQRVSAADPVYQVSDLSTLWLEIHVPLEIARQTRVKDAVSICDRDIGGTIITVGRQVHEQDQGVLVRALISRDTDHLTPGEFTQACFVAGEQRDLYVVPRNTLFRYADKPSIFALYEGEVLLLPVSVVSEQEETVVIRVELEPGSRVVVSGTAALKAAWMEQAGD